MKTSLKLLSLLAIFGLCAATQAGAQTVGLNIDSGSFTLHDSNGTTPLAVGDDLQFGYYTAATASNPFAGTFVALTGVGGLNAGLTSTVIGGDSTSGAGPGTFGYTSSDITFTQGSLTTGVGLPSAGQIVALRFYNGATPATSTYYGAVSGANWKFIAPASPAPTPMSFSLDDTGTVYLNNIVARTGTPVVAVPEPSSAGLLALALVAGAVLSWRRRVGAASIG